MSDSTDTDASNDIPEPEMSTASRRTFLKGSGVVGSAALLGGAGMGGANLLDGDNQGTVPDEPDDGGEVRHFTVHAVEVDLVYNRYGLHQPNAAVYVLEENLAEACAASGEVPCGNNVVLEDSPFCDDLPEIEGGHRGHHDWCPHHGKGHHGKAHHDHQHGEDPDHRHAHGEDHHGDGHHDERAHHDHQHGDHRHHDHPHGDDHHRERRGKHHHHEKDDQGKKHGHGGKKHRGTHHHGEKKRKKRKKDDVETRVLQPLVLRANQGDIIEIEFVNHLDRHASMHQTALPYDVELNDGMDVGFNPNTTVPPGESITYRWHAAQFGGHFFLDGANQVYDSAEEPPQVANLLSRGLFGTAVVYPQGTTYTDPYTGEEDPVSVQADIHVPEDLSQEAIDNGFVPGVSYREVVLHYHTPEGIVTSDGGQLTWPDSDEPQMVHAINYRADPTGNRIDPDNCPACDSSEFYSSWIHGDPGGGDQVYPMYVGDPVRTISVGASVEENHVHHLHNHRWKEVPPDDDSDTIDSQTIGLGAVYDQSLVPAFGTPRAAIDDFQTVRPDMTYAEAFQVGAGGAHGNAGDILFHCHLFPHYGEGMWGMLRVLDKEQKGLKTLPTNEPPIPKDSDIPGYPDFIPGEFGIGPPFPPYGAAGLEEFRDPTPAERKALTRKGEIIPGAPYTDPCDPEIDVPGYDGPDVAIEGQKREYTIVALRADVVYNDAGHHDPEGRVFVLEEDVEAVKCGDMNPEPLVIRANVGDCVEITLKNEIEEDVIPVPTVGKPDKSGGKSNHIHFVSYDVLGSDSLASGFNYNQQSLPEQELPLRWFPDEEGTIFFHDHITGVENVMNGTFAQLIIEPPESEWLDPHTGEPIWSGTQAIIQNPNGEDFREFALLYQDFAQLVDRDGEFINNDREHNENAGTMAINYRNEPYFIRDEGDPAYVHSSFVHGDPATPTLEAYENDPVRFRLLHAAYEEQHNFTIYGRKFEPEGLDPQDAVSQVIGTSEAFTMDLQPEQEEPGLETLTENPAGLPIRDYLYGSTVVDDLWTGMWGIHRVFGAKVPHLHPLPDRGAPKGKITRKELKELGHPAAFDDRATIGHEAKLRYDEDDDRAFPPDKDERHNRSIPESPPPIAPRPGDPCPEQAPDRVFDVTAFRTTIEYNDHGDQDPLGIVFAMDRHVEDIEAGRRRPTPLTLWANEGDCIQVNLTNRLPAAIDEEDLEEDLLAFLEDLLDDVDLHPEDLRDALATSIERGASPEECDEIVERFSDALSDDLIDRIEAKVRELLERFEGDGLNNDHAHPKMRIERPWNRSERISLHPTRLTYNVLGSDGATIGFNWDQTIPPGETITYRWLADEPIGTSVLWDNADIRSNRHHGAYGRIIIEPEDVAFADSSTAEPLIQGLSQSAMVKDPDGEDFREYALAFADAQYIVNEDPDAPCVVPPGPDAEGETGEGEEPDPCNQIPDDTEDQGYLGVNYRCEPFIRRFDEDPDPWQVYDSEIHGDPATPLPRALLGDPVVFRVHKTADKARGLSFHLAAHQWNRFRNVEASEDIGVDDRFTVGKADRIEPFGGAGGLAESTGDFVYQELKERRRLEAGAWGIFRVRDSLDDFQRLMQPLPDKTADVPLTERPGWEVAHGDLAGDGTRDTLIGVPSSDINGVNAGAAYLFVGPHGPITDLLDADVQFLGATHGEQAGQAVDIVRNGDGGRSVVVMSESGKHTVPVTELRRGTMDLGNL
ncbi:multicopper oxidase domain-containing protein [Halomarina pelagica]|uniref:multicopper oxidase domain-containing protein n=1 Tax=Halomarina pelagica TaxID=2961599 RepID=UPI0026E572D0|nr:multicopper oxidase domain-containing protein [Halomarina sp. BND7]